MKQKKPIITYEFGNLYIDGQPHKEGDTALPKLTFDNLWDFILSNSANDDTDSIMSVHTRGGKRYIRTRRYVGTIQTKDGQVIEILPKIYKSSGQQEDDKETCRKVFLNMLRHFSDMRAKSFQNADLDTRKYFPILEIYISNYISAVEELVLGGLKKNYSRVSENQRFLKGKLDIPRHLSRNIADKSRFAIQYNKYIENIPQNRIVVSTLRKLYEDSHSTTNKARISTLLGLLSDIPSSTNIEQDLKISSSTNRLFSAYELLIKWSSQFLLNKGFTNFSGSCVNQSLLFQAERLFENFVAYLFKRYAPTYDECPSLKAETQNVKYCLVDRHSDGKGMFRLRPDIVIETDKNNPHYDCIILDTKWKAIDGDNPEHNYLIDMKDMYQMYAYGQKYRQGETPRVGHEVIPKLILIYPYSEKFTKQLPEFVYEDILDKYGLSLMVVPFDLTNNRSYDYEKQVHNIIRSVQVAKKKQPILLQYDLEDSTFPLVAAESMLEYNPRVMMLVGCYKNKQHKDWILNNHLYNIRLGRRNGSLEKSGLMIAASRILLYDKDNPTEYQVFELDTTKQVLANSDIMIEKGYPNAKTSRSYVLYFMGSEITEHPSYDVIALRNAFAPEIKNNAPFFVEL